MIGREHAEKRLRGQSSKKLHELNSFHLVIKKRRPRAGSITLRKPLHKEQNLSPEGLFSLVVKGRTRINSWESDKLQVEINSESD